MWVFVPAKPFLPAAGDPLQAGLGGTEQAIVYLTAALARRGHRVQVAGGCAIFRGYEGVEWLPPGPTPKAAVTVAINDARLLPPDPGTPVVWFHNEVEFSRELRKRRMRPLWKHRPAAVFIGAEQARLASRMLPFRARAIIPYGLPPQILAAAPAGAPPGPQALFTSQAYRGLRPVIDMWRNQVAPQVRAARLTALIGAGDLRAYRALAEGERSITIGPRIGNDAVLETLRATRLLLAPGHRSETFCLAAAEAIAMGVPVVTLGIGSLKERVANSVTGFICRDWREMAERTRALLTDDALWRRMQSAGLATRTNNDWDRAASAWEAFVSDHP
jgi:glycosyltransferase involved in cell wall biosynthesis